MRAKRYADCLRVGARAEAPECPRGFPSCQRQNEKNSHGAVPPPDGRRTGNEQPGLWLDIVPGHLVPCCVHSRRYRRASALEVNCLGMVMKRSRQRIAPLSPREQFAVRQALVRHDEIMRRQRADAIEERISRAEGEYERLSVLSALKHAAGESK